MMTFGFRMAIIVDYGLETIPWVSNIVDRPQDSIRLDERVATAGQITVPALCGRLDVSCVVIVDSISELVFWDGLKILSGNINHYYRFRNVLQN